VAESAIELPTLTAASYGFCLAILFAFHRVFVRRTDIDAIFLGSFAAVDAGITIRVLRPSEGACHYHQEYGRHRGHQL
jgi:hypothetical protein